MSEPMSQVLKVQYKFLFEKGLICENQCSTQAVFRKENLLL